MAGSLSQTLVHAISMLSRLFSQYEETRRFDHGHIGHDTSSAKLKRRHGEHSSDSPSYSGVRQINLRQLTYFTRVVELGSITRAAADLNIAQPALGLQIRQLEADLGVSLLLRHARGIKVTKAGEVLYERANKLIEAFDETRREVSALSGTETIKIGITSSLQALIWPDIKAEALLKLPEIDLVAVPGISLELIEKLKRREIDLAFVYSSEGSSALKRMRLYDEELYLVTAPAGNRSRSPVSLRHALQMELVIQTEMSAVFHILRQAAQEIAVEPNVTYSANSTRAIIQIAAHGLAAGILPVSVIRDVVGQGIVSECRIVKPRISRVLHLVCLEDRRRSSNDEKLNAFIQRLFKKRGDTWFGPLVGRNKRRS